MRSPEERAPHGFLVALVAASLTCALCVIAFEAALEATPYETTDSQGRTMGFNDVFSPEHYGIVLDKISLGRTLLAIGPYDALLIAAHLAMAVLLLRGTSGRRQLAAALAQFAVFPLGLLGVVIFPFELNGILTGPTADRESFVDIPYAMLMSQGAWLITCAVIVVAAWRTLRQNSARARASGADLLQGRT